MISLAVVSVAAERFSVGYCYVRSIRRSMWRLAMCVAMAASVLPLQAGAQTVPTGAAADLPLRIELCVVTSRSLLLDPLNSLRIEFVSGLNVRFVNLRHATATAVRFTFRYQGDTVSLTDRGMFATGLPIERSYPTFAGQASGSYAATCNVSQVNFDDGTTWFAHPM